MEVLQRTANRGSISTGYDIDNSCKFEPDNSESMSRTPAGNGNLKTCTLSFWVKITELNKSHMFFTGDYGGAADPWFVIGLISDKIYISSTAGISGDSVVPSRLLRDTSAWYHLVFAFDTTQGTAADRIKIYVNGVQETVFTSTTYPSQNDDLDIMAAKAQGIAGYNDGTDYRFAGYMSEFVGIDGQALAPTEFGEFDANSGIWKPIDVSGLTFGTNGFYLDFKDSANLGNDASGGLDFTETNITAADQATDTPTNNFCTLNPLYAMTYPLTISEGGTKSVASGAVAQFQSAKGSMAVNNGKWYWETSNFTELNTFIGLQSADLNGVYNGAYTLNVPLNDNNLYFSDPSDRSEGFTTTKATSDVWGLALNMDDGQLSVYRNGTLQNSTVSIDGLIGNGPYTPIISQYASATNASTNFGGYNSGKAISSAETDENGYGTFEYAPPSGYYALCTKNLAEFG
jgi:hypothetical protein